jgi:calmodulin
MGAAGSIDTTLNLDGSDVDTPRGVTAKNEVRRLRQQMFDQSKETMKLMAAARFAEVDKDHSGFLENEELHHVVDWIMGSFGSKLGADMATVRKNMMTRLDINKDGKLDLEEFEELFQEMLNRTLLVERAREKFKEFDTNDSGTIESDEIRAVIAWTLQAYPVSNKKVYEERIMANIDINKDGQLDLLEFTDLFEKMVIRMDLVQKAKHKFEELDVDHSGSLENAELDNLVSWVLESHVEKTEQQRQNFRDSLMVRIDVNKDGQLDLTEFSDLFAEMLDR